MAMVQGDESKDNGKVPPLFTLNESKATTADEVNGSDAGKSSSGGSGWENDMLSASEASFITSSVRREIQAAGGDLPDAPTSDLIQAGVLLADISGFTKLGEHLRNELGDVEGAEAFADQVSECIAGLVAVVHRFSGEVVKIAGDCLICVFQNLPDEDPDDDELSLHRGKQCARALLDAIKSINDRLDIHGGLHQGFIQRIHLKELKSQSPKTLSGRQRLQARDEASRYSKAELGLRRQRWFLIAGRPIKMAGALLDKASAGSFHVFGGEVINRESAPIEAGQKKGPHRSKSITMNAALTSSCPAIAEVVRDVARKQELTCRNVLQGSPLDLAESRCLFLRIKTSNVASLNRLFHTKTGAQA